MTKKIEVVVEKVICGEMRPVVERVRQSFPTGNDGSCLRAEVSLRVMDGKVVTIHSTGFHISRTEEAVVDAVNRVRTLIPRNGGKLTVNFSEQAAKTLSAEKQRQIIALICQN